MDFPSGLFLQAYSGGATKKRNTAPILIETKQWQWFSGIKQCMYNSPEKTQDGALRLKCFKDALAGTPTACLVWTCHGTPSHILTSSLHDRWSCAILWIMLQHVCFVWFHHVPFIHSLHLVVVFNIVFIMQARNNGLSPTTTTDIADLQNLKGFWPLITCGAVGLNRPWCFLGMSTPKLED